MDRYIWESERTLQEVINSFIELTDKRNIFRDSLSSKDYKVFKYKYRGSESCRFTLDYYFAFQRFSSASLGGFYD